MTVKTPMKSTSSIIAQRLRKPQDTPVAIQEKGATSSIDGGTPKFTIMVCQAISNCFHNTMCNGLNPATLGKEISSCSTTVMADRLLIHPLMSLIYPTMGLDTVLRPMEPMGQTNRLGPGIWMGKCMQPSFLASTAFPMEIPW